jgi:hypothetical protein
MSKLKNIMASHKGIVLVLVAAGLALMLIMSVAMARLGFQSRLLTIRVTQETLARTAADAGHDRAVFELNNMTSNWPASDDPSMTKSGTLPGTKQSYTFTVTYPPVPLELSDYDPYVYDIESIGRSGTSSPKERKVFSTVVLRCGNVYGIFVQDTLDVKNSGIVDSYDSDIGPYGINGNQDMPVTIGTNACGDGDVVIRMDADVSARSEIHVGPLEGPEAAAMPCDVVTGQGDFPKDCITSESQIQPFTTWTFPSGMDPSGAATLNVPNGGEACLDCDENNVYKGIRVKNGGKVTIEGSDEVVLAVGAGGFTLDKGATLEIQTGATLMLYIGGDFIANNDSIIKILPEDDDKPARFTIRGTVDCQNIIIRNSGDFTGVLDAGYASVDIMNSGDFKGMVTAYDAVIRNSGGFHFDKDLIRASPGDLGAKFVVVRWREE